MPIRESRLKGGTLTLDAASYATQATNVRLVPSTSDDGDSLEALSGDVILPDDVTTWSLVVTAVQDFDDVNGFVNMTLTRAGELVPYSWRPSPTSPTFTGTVRVRPVEVGGEVNARLTADAEWPCQEAPTVAYAP